MLWVLCYSKILKGLLGQHIKPTITSKTLLNKRQGKKKGKEREIDIFIRRYFPKYILKCLKSCEPM